MAESNRQRRSFPDAFKFEAVAAVQGGRSVSAVAAELGLPDRLVEEVDLPRFCGHSRQA